MIVVQEGKGTRHGVKKLVTIGNIIINCIPGNTYIGLRQASPLYSGIPKEGEQPYFLHRGLNASGEVLRIASIAHRRKKFTL